MAGNFRPLEALPGTQGVSHFWVAYQYRIHRGNQGGRHTGLARFILDHPRRSGREDERIESFVVWRMFASTIDRWRWDPREEAIARGRAIFEDDGAVPLRVLRQDGVHAPERMSDGALAPATYSHFAPLASTFASRCAYVDFELGAEARPTHAFVEAFDSARYQLLGSEDGRTFSRLAGVGFPRQGRDGRFQARDVALPGTPLRILRVMASVSDGRAAIAELRLYESTPTIRTDLVQRELAHEMELAASVDAPHHVPVLHRPASDGPCVRPGAEPPLLHPATPPRSVQR